MTLRETRHYDAGPQAVYAMVTNPDFQRQAMTATHALNHHVEIGGASGSTDSPGSPGSPEPTVVTTRRTLATEHAPEAVRRMLGPSVLVTQVTTWQPARPGEVRQGASSATIEGVPLKVTGTVRLEPAGDGTDQVTETDISSRIPLIGGRIVEAVRPLLQSALDAEHRVGVDWLAHRTGE